MSRSPSPDWQLPNGLPPIKFLGNSDPTPEQLCAEGNKAKAATEGLRFDSGKVPVGLIPPEWVWALALVMKAGVDKGYPPNNWLKGMSWSKCFASLKRHTLAAEAGEWLDPETKRPHVAMAAWNALALLSYSLRGLGTDDRLPPVNLEKP